MALASATAGATLLLAVPAATASAQTFTTPGQTIYTVPAGITTLGITATGAQGGGGKINRTYDVRCFGGAGAVVTGRMTVTPGQKLYLQVGGAGGDNAYVEDGGGGVNGGGSSAARAGGGGGASDVRTLPVANGLSTDSRVLIAGGGGGSGEEISGCSGGAAGITAGAGGDGTFGSTGGGGGTQTAGGARGAHENCETDQLTNATPGTRGVGGNGGWENLTYQWKLCTVGGGGGGGGRFGGGGGAPGQLGWTGGPGGGAGSSYVAPSLSATSISTATVVQRPALLDLDVQPAGGSISVDASILPPTATIISPASSGIYLPGQTVATSFSCAEGANGSGLASCADSNGRSGVTGTIAGTLNTTKSGTFAYTVTATSKNGKTGTASYAYTVAAPPTAVVRSPAAGGVYAVGQPVATGFSCSEGNAGPGISTCVDGLNKPSPSTLDTRTTGARTYTVTATSGNGLKGTASISYRVAAAPTASISAPATGGTYAVGQRVVTAFTCADGAGGTGIDTCRDGSGTSSPGALDTSTPGTRTYTVTAKAKSGQSATKSITYTVAAAPSASISSPAADAFFATGARVATAFACQDGASGPGIATCRDGSGASSPAVLDTSAPGVHTYTVTAVSKSGQSATATRTYRVAEAPKATIAGPVDGGRFAVRASVPTSFACVDGAGGPGITSCRDGDSSTSPGRLDTRVPGTFTYTVTAASGSGRTATASITYTVEAGPSAAISAPADGGLYAVGQRVPTAFSCQEGASGSGIDTCLDGAGNASPGVLDTTTPGDHEYTVTATSRGGQKGTTAITYRVAAPPTVAIAAPGAGQTYLVGERVATAFSCDEGASGPGIESCRDGAGSSGVGFLDTAEAGPHSYTVTAVSKSGQTTTQSVAYLVTPLVPGDGVLVPPGDGVLVPGGSGTPGGTGYPAGGGTTPAPPSGGTLKPAARFALVSAKGSRKRKTIALKVRVPSAGVLRASAAGYRVVSRKVRSSGLRSLTLRPTAKAKTKAKAKAKLRRRKTSKVRVTVSFRPSGATKTTVRRTVRL